MASPDYIDVVGGVFGSSYEDVTFFLLFLTGRILACAFCVARVEATTLRVAPVTSDIPCMYLHVPRLIVPLSLERAFMETHERFWDSHRIKSMGSSQYTCSIPRLQR